jgi:hypothetical protein
VFAAVLQSGGAGIFGDFLLGTQSRFGNSLLETLAGPLAGTVGDFAKAAGLTLHGDVAAGRDQAIRAAVNTTPFINLWYTRAAMDYLFLDGMREWMSPGYKRRMLRRMRKDYGQRPIVFRPGEGGVHGIP